MGAKPICEKRMCMLAAALLSLSMYAALSLLYTGWYDRWLRGELRLHHVFVTYNTSTSTEWSADDLQDSLTFVLNTIGCKIPNMTTHYTTELSAYQPSVCGKAFAEINKLNETHVRIVANRHKQCSYNFIRRSEIPGQENNKITYTEERSFRKNVVLEIEEDFIKLKCTPNKSAKQNDEDVFAVVKKVDDQLRASIEDRWNVLVIGMDTMSRVRMLDTMKTTVTYFSSNQWIEFRGYHKVADNTNPNLVAFLTGKTRQAFEKPCYNHTLDACNPDFMWSKYKAAGYATAYTEDNLALPDTFKYMGFKNPPTDHYMRPFFLVGERVRPMHSGKSAVCVGTKTSGERILDYAVDFAQTYKNDSFFGFFWINTNSHNLGYMPEAIDYTLTETFKRLESIGTFNDTIVFFISDHGMRFGTNRETAESYYEERLPALFAWLPLSFRRRFPAKYLNMLANSRRLVTPYDIHLTLLEVLQMSIEYEIDQRSEACPLCKSLFQPISSQRTCSEAAIEEKWCSCHGLRPLANDEPDGLASVKAAFTAVQKLSSRVRTSKCYRCESFKLHSILRVHYYYNKARTIKYLVVAFKVSPGNVGYEATVAYDGKTYETKSPMSLISPHFGHSFCVINKALSAYCVCARIKRCKA